MALEIEENHEIPCNCVLDTEKLLREKGYKFHKHVMGFKINSNKIESVFSLPVERIDGKRLKLNESTGIIFSHCPFCGNKIR